MVHDIPLLGEGELVLSGWWVGVTFITGVVAAES